MPFPAALGLSGLLVAAVSHSCLVLFQKGDSQFAFSFSSAMVHPVYRFRLLFFRACTVIPG